MPFVVLALKHLRQTLVDKMRLFAHAAPNAVSAKPNPLPAAGSEHIGSFRVTFPPYKYL